MRKSLVFALLTATLALAGCPKSDDVKESPEAEQPAATGTQEGLESTGVEEGAQTGGQTEAERTMLAQRVVYFEFDSYEISPQYATLITAHARSLAQTTAVKVRLGGPHRRARLARIQHRPRREARPGRASRVAVARRRRRPGDHRELR